MLFLAKCHHCHQVSPACHQCWATPNPRRGGGYSGFLRSVTTFLVNIKKGLLVVNGREKSVGGGDNGDKYIFIYLNPYVSRGLLSPEGGDKW